MFRIVLHFSNFDLNILVDQYSYGDLLQLQGQQRVLNDPNLNQTSKACYFQEVFMADNYIKRTATPRVLLFLLFSSLPRHLMCKKVKCLNISSFFCCYPTKFLRLIVNLYFIIRKTVMHYIAFIKGWG